MGYGCEVSCNRSLPAVYDDSLDYYEQLCKMYKQLQKLVETNATNSEDIANLKEAVKQLGELLDRWAEGEFDSVIEKEVVKWIGENVKYIFDTYSKQVFFGLTDTGYFCAYVPESWSDIEFDTGAAYGEESYGRLILRYSVAGEGVIDNTKPNYPNKNLEEEIKALQDNMHEVRHTLYTALTERRL